MTTTEHPSYQRATRLANLAGSKAKTSRGIIRAAITVMRRNASTRRSRPDHRHPDSRDQKTYHAIEVIRWRDAVKARKSSPEGRRARDDQEFRQKYLARQRRAHAAAVACRQELDSVQSWHHPSATAARADAVAKLNDSRRLVGGRVKIWPALPTCPVACGTLAIGDELAESLGVSVCRRGMDWFVRADYRAFREHEGGETEWRGGRPIKYTRATNTTHVVSFGFVDDAGILHARIVKNDVSLAPPAGLRWEVDAHGICLTDGIDTYHPTASNVLDGIGTVCQRRLDLIEARQEMADEKAISTAVDEGRLGGVFVCRKDSLRAGNCPIGTDSWISKKHIQEHHVPASVLARLGDGPDHRMVRLALCAALRRHRNELHRGFAVLSDHR